MSFCKMNMLILISLSEHSNDEHIITTILTNNMLLKHK